VTNITKQRHFLIVPASFHGATPLLNCVCRIMTMWTNYPVPDKKQGVGA